MREAMPIANHQNKIWLRTEYDTAVKRASQAANWKQFEREADVLPNLEWLKTTSVTPAADHAGFWSIPVILPVNDPFWDTHKPGDRWGCKCSLRATDKPAMPEKTIPEGDSTDKPAPGLTGNPAKDGQIFSDTHPYNPPSCAACTLPGKRVLLANPNNRLSSIFKSLSSRKDCYHCSKPVQLIKKSVKARERNELETAMEGLLKKNVIRKIAPDKQIKITFKKSGNAHIVNDILEKGVKLSKADLAKLNDIIREAKYVRSSELYKGRKDDIQKFYYFKDKDKKEVYYNIAEEVVVHKKGKITFRYYPHSVTKDIPKKRKNQKAGY
jgi:hypothetical protein